MKMLHCKVLFVTLARVNLRFHSILSLNHALERHVPAAWIHIPVLGRAKLCKLRLLIHTLHVLCFR